MATPKPKPSRDIVEAKQSVEESKTHHSMSPDPTRLCFTDLPYASRLRIYTFAGLVRICPIDLNQEGARRVAREKFLEDRLPYASPGSEATRFETVSLRYCHYRSKQKGVREPHAGDPGCVCIPLPYHLLYVSHAIHDEVRTILYSKNKFKICRSAERGLEPLLGLGSAALASLTSICIRMNSCSCTSGPVCFISAGKFCCCGGYHISWVEGEDGPTSHETINGQAVVQDWESLCDALSTRIRPHQLHLDFVCDTAGLPTALQVARAFKRLPVLKRCTIRLGQSPNDELRRLSHLTALQASGRPTTSLSSPFRFLDLPAEIRNRVLYYTNLVAPGDLYWSVNRGLMTSRYGDRRCCKRCTDTLEACCCPSKHAAFPLAGCSCWQMPTAILQLSRQMHNEGSAIFYSKNRFEVDQSCDPQWRDDLSADPTSSALMFLRHIPTNCLHHLRFLRVILMHVHPDSYPSVDAGSMHWIGAIEFIEHHLVVEKLSITLDYSSHIDDEPEDDLEDEVMWATFERLIKPLEALRNLWRLYVYISFPRHYENRDILRSQHERELEQRIMGPAYESEDFGKRPRRKGFCNNLSLFDEQRLLL